jgi:hypothetical protein
LSFWSALLGKSDSRDQTKAPCHQGSGGVVHEEFIKDAGGVE